MCEAFYAAPTDDQAKRGAKVACGFRSRPFSGTVRQKKNFGDLRSTSYAPFVHRFCTSTLTELPPQPYAGDVHEKWRVRRCAGRIVRARPCSVRRRRHEPLSRV